MISILKEEYENADITEEVLAILVSIEKLVGKHGQPRKENIGLPKLTLIFNGINYRISESNIKWFIY